MDDIRKALTATAGPTRRQLLAGAAALGVAGMSGPLAGSALAQGTPKRGGQLRMGVPGGATTDSIDPATFNETFMQCVGFGPLRNNLAEISPDNKVVPELAESWEASKDAKTWTFKLRKGVQFHNGKTLEAADVVASFNHHRGAETKSQAKALARGITDIKADGSSTVVFTLESGNADFPALTTDYHFGIMPANADGTADWKSGQGTGGYKLDSFDPGVRAQLSRNAGYWKPNAAWFDGIEVLAITDVAARQNALVSGQVDVIDRIDLKTIGLLRRDQNIVVENVPGRLHYTWEMNTTMAPFNDVNVRLAIKHAVDRKALLDSILFGYGLVANDQPISPAYTYYDPSLPQRTYDPEKAKFHLGKAGHSTLDVDLNVSEVAFNGATDAAVLFKEQAAKGGINVNVVRNPADGYFSKIWGKAAFAMSYYTGRPTEDGILSIVYLREATMNTAKWDNARANELIIAARAELDSAKRREMYGEVQRLISDDGGFMIPLFANYVFARNRKLSHGPSLSSERSLDGAKLCERWWFA